MGQIGESGVRWGTNKNQGCRTGVAGQKGFLLDGLLAAAFFSSLVMSPFEVQFCLVLMCWYEMEATLRHLQVPGANHPRLS
jgi:hypothetical protein